MSQRFGLLLTILSFVHNSVYYCFSFYFITFPQKIKHFRKKSGATVFHVISKNPVFMRISGFLFDFQLHFFRLPHFFMYTSMISTFLYVLQYQPFSILHFQYNRLINNPTLYTLFQLCLIDFYIVWWIFTYSIYIQFKMQMCSRRISCCTNITNYFTFFNIITT